MAPSASEGYSRPCMARLIALTNLEQLAAVNLTVDQGLVAGPKIVAQCAQITLKFSLASGKVGHVVLGGRYTGAFAGSQAQANAIHTALSTGGGWAGMAQHLSTSTSFIGVDIRNIAIPDQAIISSNTAAAAGTSTGSDMPNEIAVVITLRTGLTGPRYRGRMYLPGWATTALGSGNLINSAAVGTVTNWFPSVGAALSAQGYTHCLALPERNAYTSIRTGRVFPARPQETPAVISARVDTHWDSQRRRGLK